MAEETRDPRPASINKTPVPVSGGTGSSYIPETTSSLSPDNRGYKATGTYIYKTDEYVEKFGKTKYEPPIRPKNNLQPAGQYIQPQQSAEIEKEREIKAYCKRNPSDPKCQDRPQPAHDEQNIYQELGVFSEAVKDIFEPESRMKVQKKKKTERPVGTLYQQNSDNIQLTEAKVVRSECRCKDGRVVLGYLNTRSGQKDCSACDQKEFKSPNIYKNYKTKRQRVFSDKPAKLRQQIGVSTFGDVDMKGCQTQQTSPKQIKNINANKNLNQVISTTQSRGQRVTTPNATPINPSKRAFSIYDNCNTNIYGI